MTKHTYSDGKFIYDVADFQKAAGTYDRFIIPTKEVICYLEDQRWEDAVPIDFLCKVQPKYSIHEDAIARADLSYPIIFGPNH
jgi:hypothetical protein